MSNKRKALDSQSGMPTSPPSLRRKTTSGTTASSLKRTANNNGSGSASSDAQSVQPGDAINIESYTNAHVIARFHDDVVAVRAISTARGGMRVLLKFGMSPKATAAASFNAEAALLQELHDAGIHNISQPIAREVGPYGPMIVAKDEGFRFFKEVYLPPDRRPPPHWTDESALLNVIDHFVEVVRSLSAIHDLQVVHGSLRPTSLSLDPLGQVFLHDFSCAFRKVDADIETNPSRERGLNEANLPYLAPECTGRVSKAADYRSDYYSLGAVMYEIFSGKVPFHEASDPLEMMHCHLAVKPPSMNTIDPSIPSPLAQIVAKLLEKEPEARYQSAQGLLSDLQRVSDLVRSQAQFDASLMPQFSPGHLDEVAQFHLPSSDQIYGRQKSIEDLASSYEAVRSDKKPHAAFVIGHSGIGKSKLIETLRKPVIRSRGFFTGAKFDQIASPVPFMAITQSIAGVVRQILATPESELLLWRKKLKKALGRDVLVLTEVLSSFENVFEPDWLSSLPQPPTLSGASAEARFHDVVQRALRVFAAPEHPLVVVFDDLQWSTPADISFILRLAASKSPMLLVASYRDNEVGEDHIVTTTLLPGLRDAKMIRLAPLNLQDILAFVTDSLKTPMLQNNRDPRKLEANASIRNMAHIILDRTQGSPLFVAQLLKTFHAEGLFHFDFVKREWEFDLDAIADSSMGVHIVDLLSRQISRFSEKTREVLGLAACLGAESDAELLARAMDSTLADVTFDLREAVDAGLLLTKGFVPIPEAASRRGSHQSSDGPMINVVPRHYSFFHDRCQQAAYALIPAENRNKAHYNLGLRLIETGDANDLQAHVFEYTNQVNYGIDIVQTDDERDSLAKINYSAASRAFASTAFEAARKYLQTAKEVLGDAAWARQPDLTSKVVELLVDTEFSLADYRASQTYVSEFLAHSTDVIARMRVYGQSIRAATATGESQRAIDIGRETLSQVEVDFPHEASVAETIADSLVRRKASRELITALQSAPQCLDAKARGRHQIFAALIPPTYFTRIDLLPALTALTVQSVLDNGLDDASAIMLTLHAVLVAAREGHNGNALEIGRVAVEHVRRHGSSPFAGPIYKIWASHVLAWSVPLRDTLPAFRQAITYCLEYRDGEYLGFGSGELCSHSILAGLPLSQVLAEVERYNILVRQFRNELSTIYIGVILQVALNLTGKAAEICEIDGEAFSKADYQICEEKGYALTLHLVHLLRLMLALFFGNRSAAGESRTLGRRWIHGGQGLTYVAMFELYEAVSLSDEDERTVEELRTVLGTAQKRLAQRAQDNAQFQHAVLWLQAETRRVEGSTEQAVQLYDEAIASAVKQGFVHHAACMNERCSRILSKSKLAAGYLLEARSQWDAWGCAPKVTAIIEAFPDVFPTLKLAEGAIDESCAPYNGPALPTPRGLGPSSVLPSTAEASSSNEISEAMTPSQHQDDLGATSFPFPPRAPLEDKTLGSNTVRPPEGRSRSVSSHHSAEMQSRVTRSLTDLEALSVAQSFAETSTRSQLANELDLRTVVSASASLGNETSVDGVVAKLLTLALRTAGADLCLLVLEKQRGLCAEAIAKTGSYGVQHLRQTVPIDEDPVAYPCSVIHYVARSRSMVVNNLDALGEAISDPYLSSTKPRSILCLPLVLQSRIVGVIYMENSQSTNAFTPDRLEIITLVVSQAASVVEKARLMQDLQSANSALENYSRNLESTVADRTIELRDKNSALETEIREKERLREIAESATAMKSEFLASMSHEIRTPFNAVVALAGLLLETPLTPLQTDYVETIKNSGTELLVVINDILDLSKIEGNKLDLSQDRVELRAALESSLDMVAERAASKSLELALFLEPAEVSFIGDLTRLRQICVNLLSNAVKFTSEGEVTITASAERIPSAEKEREQVKIRISVADTGIGIAKKDFPKLFRAYSQVEGSETTKAFGGTGLGLAISKRLSTLMGGDLTLDSEVGDGSTFTLEFSAPCVEIVEDDAYSANENADLVGKRCLIVDGHSSGERVLVRLMTSFGFAVEVPDDISLAYKMITDANEAGQPYDVLIVDIFIQGFLAQTLLRRLRQAEVRLPTVALTRMGSPIYEDMKQYDCKFLIKPIKRKRLHHAIRSIFPLRDADHTATPRPRSPPTTTEREPLAILCAEDNPVNVKVITHLLKRLGYTADIAEDGLVAVEKAQRKRYDLIFMDMNMPRMDGLEATRKICEVMPDKDSRPIIVAMTANAMPRDKQRCLEAGCDGYVSKPILVPELSRELENASQRVRRTRPAATERTQSGTPSNTSNNGEVALDLSASTIARRGSRRGTIVAEQSRSQTGSPAPSSGQR